MSDYVKSREQVEWSNTWIDDANVPPTGHRVLFLGDSTLREVRSTFKKKINCPVDFFGCSFALRDPLFWSNLELFLASEYAGGYDLVVVQTGNHSRVGLDGGAFTDADHEDFSKNFERLVKRIQTITGNIVIFPAFLIVRESKIPTTLRSLLRIHDVYDDRENVVVLKRNELIRDVAKRLGATYGNFTGFMAKRKFVHKDHIHYENKAKETMADYIYSMIPDSYFKAI